MRTAMASFVSDRLFKKAWFYILPLAFVFLIFMAESAFSSVTVQSTDRCTRIVTVKIEIYAGKFPYYPTDAEFDKMSKKKQDWWKSKIASTSHWSKGYLEQNVAPAWKKEFEDAWNGPTSEKVNEAADAENIKDSDVDKAAWDPKKAKEITEKANDLKEAAGGDMNCAQVNCCRIYFRADIKVRGPDEDPTEGYYQVLVATADFRSLVWGRGGPGWNGLNGMWSHNPSAQGRSHAAHEIGHLMGLGDEYKDQPGKGSVPNHGHEDDMMATTHGWPTEEDINEILAKHNVECDCCPRDTLTDQQAQSINLAIVFAHDAIAGCNPEYLDRALQALKDQLRNLQLNNTVSVKDKIEMAARLQRKIAQVEQAKKDCPKEEDTAVTTGTDGNISTDAPFSFDSNVCHFYGGGTMTLPVTPLGPFVPGGSISGPLGGIPTTPGSVPGGTPPGETPPGGTPPGGTPPGETPPGTITPEGPFTPSFPVFPQSPVDPIPPSAFDPGSDPFDGPVPRPPTTTTPGDGDQPETFDAEIIEMSLTGSPPIAIPLDEEKTPEDEDEPQMTPTPAFVVKAERTVLEGDDAKTEPVEGAVLKLGFPPPDMPHTGAVRTAEDTDAEHNEEPRHVVTDENGIGVIFTDGFESGDTSMWSDTVGGAPTKRPVTGARLDMTPTKSSIVYLHDQNPAPGPNVAFPESGPGPADTTGGNGTGGNGGDGPQSGGNGNGNGNGSGDGDNGNGGSGNGGGPASGGKEELPDDLKPYEIDRFKMGNTWGVTLQYRYDFEDEVFDKLEGYDFDENHYRDKQTDDPYHQSRGSWDQDYDDQWAIKRVGFTDGDRSAWDAAGDDLESVVVAVIDTGLDWNHADIS